MTKIGYQVLNLMTLTYWGQSSLMRDHYRVAFAHGAHKRSPESSPGRFRIPNGTTIRLRSDVGIMFSRLKKVIHTDDFF